MHHSLPDHLEAVKQSNQEHSLVVKYLRHRTWLCNHRLVLHFCVKWGKYCLENISYCAESSYKSI